MNWSMILLSTLLAISSLSNAQVSMDVRKVKKSSVTSQHPSLLERNTANTIAVTIDNTALCYITKIAVGTPPQTLEVIVDTGTADTWVPSSSAAVCGKNTLLGGCAFGSFNTAKSSTFHVDQHNGFNVTYDDGTGARGDFIRDTLTIGGATVERLQMGLAVATSTGIGALGIGYPNDGDETPYPKLVDALVSAGLVPTQAYSLWLNDLNQDTGSILFGAIDTAKYHGDLISVDVQPWPGSSVINSFFVDWTFLVVKSATGHVDTSTPIGFNSPAMIDSGTTITFLPNAIAELVFREVGAAFNKTLKVVMVPCSLASSATSLEYGFGSSNGPLITVPMSELVVPYDGTSDEPPTDSNGDLLCLFGIQPADHRPTVFGDTFLRSAYAVFDLVNNKIAMANAVLNATKSHIVPFASQGASIPRASQASQTIVASATGSAPMEPFRPDGVSLLGSTLVAGPTTSSAPGSPQSTSSPTSTGAKSGSTTISAVDGHMLGVVMGSVAMMLLGGSFFFAL